MNNCLPWELNEFCSVIQNNLRVAESELDASWSNSFGFSLSGVADEPNTSVEIKGRTICSSATSVQLGPIN